MVNTDNCPTLFEENPEVYFYLNRWLRGILPLIIGLIGLILNTGAICILFPRQRLQSIFKLLLINLLAWDSILLLITIGISSKYYISCSWSPDLSRTYIDFLLPFWDISFSQTVFTTVALSFDRYICYCHRLKYDKLMEHHGKSKLMVYLKFISPMTIFAFLFHIPSFNRISEFRVQGIGGRIVLENNGTDFDMCHTVTKIHYEFAMFHGAFARLFVEGIIPLTIVVICNWKSYKKVTSHISENFIDPPEKLQRDILEHKRTKNMTKHIGVLLDDDSEISPKIALSSQARKIESKVFEKLEKDLAFAMVGIVTIFVIYQVPHITFHFCEWIYLCINKDCFNDGKEMYPSGVLVLKLLAYLLIITNCSTNAVVYCFLDTRFKKKIVEYISQICKRKKCETSNNITLTHINETEKSF